VTSAARDFVLFKTDLFVFRQLDADIDRWSVGGDCAAWFYVRLLLVEPIRPSREPLMDEWGWVCEVAIRAVRIRLNVWAFHPVENCWILGIEVERRLFGRPPADEGQQAKALVCQALDDILAHDARMLKREWFAENPFDLDVQEF
jgi:hypothetical protein